MAKKTTYTAKAKTTTVPPKHNTVAGRARQHARQLRRIAKRRAAKTTKTTKARAWSPDETHAVCSARAVAESLRLTLGVAVADADVLALHAAAGGHPDRGAPILDVLRAAQQHGLGGHRPQRFECIAGPLSAASERVVSQLVLGLDDPPHAIVADSDVWWSWGEPHAPADFPGAVVEECWAVTW